MSLIIEYSWGYLLLCLLLGVAFSFALYYRNRAIEFDRTAKITMAILRGITTSLLAFLLLAPMLKRFVKEIDKPILIVAVDNSESMTMTSDSAFYQNQFPDKVNHLIHAFNENYDVKTYLIGETAQAVNTDTTLAFPFSEKTTRLSALFDDVTNLYANQNVGAMVLISDGIYNAGSNPQYQVQQLKCPVHTVLAGDTTVQTDLRLAQIMVNKQTYKGNYFPVELKVAATHLAGNKVTLTIFEKEEAVFTKTIDIRSNQHFETVKMSLLAKDKGIQKYRVELSPLADEVTYRNNTAQFLIEVVDAREKIAVLYYAPHPDVAAIKSALETADKYEVETFSAQDFSKNIHDYSLIILHQLPAKPAAAQTLLATIQQEGIPALYVVGSRSDLQQLSTMGCGVTIAPQGEKVMFNQAYPYYNENFLTFTFSEEARQMLRHYPPLQTIFGNYQTAIGANVFMYQKISNVESTYPLIAFSQNGKARTGIIVGTDIWRWRLQNYLHTQNFDAFNEIINKTALYLSVKGDKSNFRVLAQDVYNENMPVTLTAELYNDSYELITEPDVRFVLTDANGKEYVSQFSKQLNSYYLSLGKLPVGDYTWEASALAGTKSLKKSGSFTVQEVMLESQNLTANPDVMRAIATNSNGKSLTIQQLDNLESLIKEDKNIKPIATYQKKYHLLLNSWFYLSLIILLLGIEWFMRKWGGGY